MMRKGAVLEWGGLIGMFAGPIAFFLARRLGYNDAAFVVLGAGISAALLAGITVIFERKE